MGMCYAPDCWHRSEYGKCKFMKFPKSPGRRRKWLNAANRRDGRDPKSATLCSCHFPGGDKTRTPSIFRRNEKHRHLFNTPRSARRPRRRLVAETPESPKEGLVIDANADQLDDRFTPSSPWKVTPVKYKRKLLPPSPNPRENHQNHTTESENIELPNKISHGDLTIKSLQEENQKCHIQLSNLEAQISHLKEELRTAQQNVTSARGKCTGLQQISDIQISEKAKLVTDLNIHKSLLQNLAEVNAELTKNSEILKNLHEEKIKMENKVEILQENVRSVTQDLVLSQEAVRATKDELKRLKEREKMYKEEQLKETANTVSLEKKVQELRDRSEQAERNVEGLMKVSEVLKREKCDLKKEVYITKHYFRFENFCTESNIAHYTGLPNLQTFYWLLEPFPGPLNYYMGSNVKCLDMANQLFLTLLKLKHNFSNDVLSHWFCVSSFTVTNVVYTWICAMEEVLVDILMAQVPSRPKNQQSMPAAFAKYSNCRMILDCTEVLVQVPNRMSTHNLIYSQYKHRTTFKGLVGIAPNGTVTFASILYPGSTTDKHIVQKCGVLNVFKPGDSVMADKGFLIKDDLPAGVTLNLPPFKETPQFTTGQVVETLSIARARIHVERAIQRIKSYHVLDFIEYSMYPFASSVFRVCAALTNCKCLLIKEVEGLMRCPE